MGRLQTSYNWCIFHRDTIITLFIMPFSILFFAFFVVSSLPYEFIIDSTWLHPIIDGINMGMWMTWPMLLAAPIVGMALYKESRQKILVAGAVFWVAIWYIWNFFINII